MTEDETHEDFNWPTAEEDEPMPEMGQDWKGRAQPVEDGGLRVGSVMLVIRDPDWENEYVTDADVNIYTVDIGGQFRSYKDLQGRIEDGREEAVAFLAEHLGAANGLPDGAAKTRLVEFVDDAMTDAPTDVKRQVREAAKNHTY